METICVKLLSDGTWDGGKMSPFHVYTCIFNITKPFQTEHN